MRFLLPFTLLAAPAAAAEPALCPPAITAIDASAAKSMTQGSPGFAVGIAVAGRPVLLRSYGLANLEDQAPVERGSVFNLASVTKQFTSAAVLLLAEDGRLKLDDKLSAYVPELPQAKDVTLYQLLVHTSGIPDYAEDPQGDKTKSVAKSPKDMLDWIATLKPAHHFPPGSKWAYSNSNYALLGLVIERVGGKPLSTFFQERLFAPAGLTHTAFDDPRDVVPKRAKGYRRAKTTPSGFANADWIHPSVPGAAGGLRTTIDDLLRWSDALFSGRILKRESLEKMIAPGRLSDGRTTKLGMPEDWQKGLNSDYGLGVFLTPSEAGPRISHAGDMPGFSTWLAYYPERRLTIAVLQNSQSADTRRDEIAAAALAGLACL